MDIVTKSNNPNREIMPRGTRVFMGNLSHEANERDVERFFKVSLNGIPLPFTKVVMNLEDNRNFLLFAQGYGIIEEISLKQGYGFVEFEDSRDADDAIADLDGKSICGRRVQVELATGDKNARRDGDRYST